MIGETINTSVILSEGEPESKDPAFVRICTAAKLHDIAEGRPPMGALIALLFVIALIVIAALFAIADSASKPLVRKAGANDWWISLIIGTSLTILTTAFWAIVYSDILNVPFPLNKTPDSVYRFLFISPALESSLAPWSLAFLKEACTGHEHSGLGWCVLH